MKGKQLDLKVGPLQVSYIRRERIEASAIGSEQTSAAGVLYRIANGNEWFLDMAYVDFGGQQRYPMHGMLRRDA